MPAVIAPPAPTGMIPAVSATSAATSGRPQQWKWTLVEYRKLGKTGFFDGRRVQLIFGEVVEMGKQGWPHVVGCRKTADILRRVFAGTGWINEQSPFPHDNSEPEPDVAVIPGRMEDYTDHPETAWLVVEVSDTSLSYDVTTKAELYATAGVPDYWVIDVEGRCLHVFRDPVTLPAGLGATAYSVHLTLAATDIVSPLAAPHATVTVADLLP